MLAIRIEHELTRCELVALRKLIILIKKKPRLSGKELERRSLGLILEATETLNASCDKTNKLVDSMLAVEKKKAQKN